MVGNTGRKCISQGINVIAGGRNAWETHIRHRFGENPAKSVSKYIILWLKSSIGPKCGTDSRYVSPRRLSRVSERSHPCSRRLPRPNPFPDSAAHLTLETHCRAIGAT